MNVPSSSMTVGLAAGVVGAAKTVVVMAQMETRNPRRRAMAARENSCRALRVLETSEQGHEKEIGF